MAGAFAAGHTGFAGSSGKRKVQIQSEINDVCLPCPLVIIGNFIVIPSVLPDEDNVVFGDRC